jgi:hypothetical protein
VTGGGWNIKNQNLKGQNIEKAIRIIIMSKTEKIRTATKLIRTSKVTYLWRFAFLS